MSNRVDQEKNSSGIIRMFSPYQIAYLGTLYRTASIEHIGRIDETNELVVSYIVFGKVVTVKIPYAQPEYT